LCALDRTGLAAGDVAAAPPLAHIGAPDHALSYVFKYVPEEMSLSAHPWNAQIAEAWIYARLFDESGKQYVLMRTVRDLKSNGVTLTTDGKPDPRILREAVDITRTVDPAAGLVFSGKEFRVTLSPTAVAWTDQGGAISLQGSQSPLGQ